MYSKYHIKKVEFQSGRTEYWIYQKLKLTTLNWLLLFPILVFLSIVGRRNLHEVLSQMANKAFEMHSDLETAELALEELQQIEAQQAEQEKEETADRTITKISNL